MKCARCELSPLILVCVLAALWASPRAGAAVLFGQLDDFQDGTDMGWEKGGASDNPPTNVAGGLRGPADRYLRNVALGGFGSDSRMAMFNDEQWGGNYNAEGVTRIEARMTNFGPETLRMRVALTSTAGTIFATTRAVVLPANSGWQNVTFRLAATDLTRTSGAQTLAQALAAVDELRLLSSGSPNHRGDPVTATLGVDNLRATHTPGDANFDGVVNTADFRTLRRNYRDSLSGTARETWARGDFNFDQRVNSIDLALLRQNLTGPGGAASSDVTAVPEPAAGAAVLCGAAMLLLRARTHSLSRYSGRGPG